MSILDGKVILDGERFGNPNKKGNRGNNNNFNSYNDEEQETSRRYTNKYKPNTFGRSSYLSFGEEEDEEVTEKHEKKDMKAETIYAFVDEFTNNSSDFRRLIDVIADELPATVKCFRGYYNPKNSPAFTVASNRLIKLAGTSNFCKALAKVLENGYWQEDGVYDRCFRNVAFLLSTALEVSHDRMHTEVVRKYATDILPRMWKPEIEEMRQECGITADLALDLIIAIPMLGTEWNAAQIDTFYNRFLDKMLIHAEDNSDIMNWEVQGMLYDKFFNNGGKNTKTGLKVIGKYLVTEPIKEEDLDSKGLSGVYNNFKKMLYSKLDTYDIKDISFVFKFVAEYRKEKMNNNEDVETIFSSRDVTNFDNVRKGLLQTMDDNKDLMSYLA